VGQSGKVLNEVLAQAELDRDEFVISNAVLCKTPKNREPTEEEMTCCRPRLLREIKERGVKNLVALGGIPRRTMLPELGDQSVTATRGLWFEKDGLNILTTWHPAYILHGRWEAMTDLQLDFQKFKHGRNTLPDPKVLIIKDHKTLQKAVDAALKASQPICVDLETSNVDKERSTPQEWWNGYIICLGFHWLENKAFVVPEELCLSKKTWQILKPMIGSMHGIFGHNIKFDAHYLLTYYETIGIDIAIKLADDTLLMHYLLDENSAHGLKDLCQYYFDAPDWEQEIHKYLKKPRVDSYCKVPRPVLYKYLGYDIQYSIALRNLFIPMLKEQELWERPYRMLIMPADNVLVQTERRSLVIDEARLGEAKQKMTREVITARENLREIVDMPDLNPNAPHQVAEAMYDRLGLVNDRVKKTRRITIGPRSTCKEVLIHLQDRHPFVKEMLHYRRWNKLLTTYANKLDNYRDKHGVSHFEYKLHGTETGRLSAGLLLTIPRKYTPEGKLLRRSFVAHDGHAIISADFSQAELRWAGWYSQEQFLYDVYSTGRDLHDEVAKAMYGEDFNREQRMHAKMFNFAYVYGGTEYSFADDAGLPIEEAKAWVARYNKLMPGLNEWKENLVEDVKQVGSVRTPVGRVRRFPIITNKNFWDVRNSAINFPVQSISSDTTLWGFVLSAEYFQKMGMPVYPALFLHDGVYFVCKADSDMLLAAARKIREFMLGAALTIQKEAGFWFPEFKGKEILPFKVDMELGYSWGGLEDFEPEEDDPMKILGEAGKH
jgi:DNA polymerase-1